MAEEILKLRDIKNFKDLVYGSIEKYPDNIVFEYKKTPKDSQIQKITYKQYGEDIKALSTALLDLGLSEKRIAVIGNNRYEWCTSYMAVTNGNMVIVPLDKALPDNELESTIIRSEASAIIFDKKYENAIKNTIKDSNCNIKFLICMDDLESADVINYSELLEKGRKLVKDGDNRFDNIEIDNKKMSVMLFTSGTTTKAKAVMLSQENISTNVMDYYSHFRLYPTDTLLSFLPIHHTFECSITFLYGVYCGVTIAFCDGLKYIQQNLKDFKVSVFVAVPLVMETMYKRIMKAVDEQGKTKLIKTASKISNALLKIHIDIRKKIFKQILEQLGGNLRVVLYGGASIDFETIVGFNNFGIELIQGYGLTETSPVLAAEGEKRHRPGSIGYVLPHVELKIDKPDVDGIGEILAKGPNIMLGYYNDEQKTKEAFQDGWFKTGDFGYCDQDGYFFVTGRKSDIIVLRNGKNIYPQEIEFLINKIPGVEESMVFARNKDNTDTMLCAKIVYNKENMKEIYPDKEENKYKDIFWEQIKELNIGLPNFKHIKNIIVTDEPMAKTTTQKVRRFEEIKKVEAGN